MGDIINVNPEQLKRISGEDLRTHLFYDFLVREERMPELMKRTKYFRHYLNQVKAGVHPNRINGINGDTPIKQERQIIKRLQYLINLYDLVRRDPCFNEIDKIQVTIDQRGRIRIFEGAHRAICSLVAGINKIPVEVVRRHPDWVAFIESMKKEYGGEKLYNPINHPDFDNWPIIQEDRAAEILDYIEKCEWLTTPLIVQPDGYKWGHCYTPCHYWKDEQSWSLKGLDLGCHFGFFCHYFEREGAVMTGVEGNKAYYETAQYLNRVYEANVDFRHSDIWEFLSDCEKKGRKFDFVNMLSVFYALNRNKSYGQQVLQFLNGITDLVFVDTYEGEELTDDELRRLFKENTDFVNFEVIHTGKNGRRIYAFSKERK